MKNLLAICTTLLFALVAGAFADEGKDEEHASSYETWDSEDSDAQYYRSLQDSLRKPATMDRLLNVAITITTVIVCMVVSVWLSYLSAICLDRYGNLCCHVGPQPLTDEEWAVFNAANRLTLQSGLAGITAKERFQILEYFFQNKNVYDYQEENGKKDNGELENVVIKVQQKLNELEQAEEDMEDLEASENIDLETTTGDDEESNPKNEKVVLSVGLSSTAAVRSATAKTTTLEISQGVDINSTEDMTLSPPNNTTTTTATTVVAAPIYDQDEDIELQGLCCLDHADGSCPICLAEYQAGDKVMTGTQCNHVFHYSCAMQWLNRKEKPSCHCPFCRKDMLTPMEYHQAARLVLGEERIKSLIQKDILAVAMIRQAAMHRTVFPASPINFMAFATNTNDTGNSNVVVVVPTSHQLTIEAQPQAAVAVTIGMESSTPPSVVQMAAPAGTLTTANAAAMATVSDTPIELPPLQAVVDADTINQVETDN